jgi:Cu-processing system permease protein
MQLQQVLTIAGMEWRVNLRNKWMVIFAGVFCLLVLAISYAGTRAEGFTGLQSFSRTSASLLNLVLYLVPLIAVVMGTISFTSEKGALELLIAQPVRRSEVVAGKVLGLFASMSASTVIGFLTAGVVIAPMTGGKGILSYCYLVLLTQFLGLIFLIIAALISFANDRRQKAFGYTLFVWFFFLIFYDLIVIGLTVVAGDVAAKYIIFFSLFGNPVDIVRVGALIILDNVTIFGVAGAMLLRFVGGVVGGVMLLSAALLIWIAVPFAVALRLVKKQDI